MNVVIDCHVIYVIVGKRVFVCFRGVGNIIGVVFPRYFTVGGNDYVVKNKANVNVPLVRIIAFNGISVAVSYDAETIIKRRVL